MSITQDYELLKKQLGTRKYKALEEYINTFGKIKDWERGIKEIRRNNHNILDMHYCNVNLSSADCFVFLSKKELI